MEKIRCSAGGTHRNPWSFAALAAALTLAIAAPVNGADSPSYKIGPGDVLQVTIYAGGEEQENFSAAVSSHGTITTPLLGELSVAGKLPTEVAQLLTTRLSQGYYVKPQAIVSVKEYAGKVYITGEVRRPGAYDIRDGLSVLNACILAGGFSDYAAPNRVKLTRLSKGRTEVITIDLRKVQKGQKPDMPLLPGDLIEVPHRRF
jgi:protein involved in polysaccharide export with SLBB domain